MLHNWHKSFHLFYTLLFLYLIYQLLWFVFRFLDVTHSLQQPNQSSGITGGQPELIETIAKAGIASGVDGIFIETHHNPSKAKSDGKNMLKLDQLRTLIEKLIKLKNAI